jgi:gamma-glutamyltranspeptidase/glutathione hydrolase
MNRLFVTGLLVLAPALAHGQGVVVSVSPPASKVGQGALDRGGNAVDAAVAVGFALAVTWPEAGNIGGGGFMMVRPAGPKSAPVVVDYRETAPAAATRELFVKHGRKPHLTVGVPGSVAGLALAHQKYGKLPWKELVGPAVALAEEGFAIDDALAGSLNRALARSKDFAELRRVYGKSGGGRWRAGDRLVQKELARTLRRIADKGSDGFYKGETAELLVKEMKAGRGLITAADLAGYQAKQRSAIRGTYRGHDVYVPPPPSSGVCVLLMLHALEDFDLKKHGRYSAHTLHVLTEVMRRAYCDRARDLGDPDYVKIPIDLASREHARKLAQDVDSKRATPSEAIGKDIPLSAEPTSTTHYSVVDAAGMAVSTTTTLEASFGSRVVVRGAGFLLNNEMTDFNPRPGVTTRAGLIGTPPNLIAPGKRMLSSMTPTVVVKDGRVVLVTGSPGGRTILNTVLEVVLNVLEFDMPLGEAVAAPRMHHQWFPDRLQVEAKLAQEHAEAIASLEKRGHKVMKVRLQGDAHSIWLDPKTKRYQGVTDWRRAGRPASFGKQSGTYVPGGDHCCCWASQRLTTTSASVFPTRPSAFVAAVGLIG